MRSPSNSARNAAAAIVLALGSGCGEAGQERVSIPLFVAGSESSEASTTDGTGVVLERADLAFGPLYLCAGSQAGELCETARLEWLASVVVDALSPERQRAGTLEGTNGPVRSWMYDLGLSSQLTHEQPLLLDAAEALGGFSAVVEGRAERNGVSLPFRIALRLQQSEQTEQGVPVVRKSSSDAFARDVTGDERLTVRFDPATWIAGIDFTRFQSESGCEASVTMACVGQVEERCADDGTVLESRDCAELSQICVPGSGCTKRIEIDADTQAYRALRNALAAGERPRFEWH